jgi:hypothetical protein
MKIRIKGNFLRYRLTQTEVQTLANTGTLVEETHFGPGADQKLAYAIVVKDGLEHLDADFQNNRINLYVPSEQAKNWPGEERVGFSHTKQISPDTTLFLLLEKDFVCLDDTAEDQSDNYPNPLKKG